MEANQIELKIGDEDDDFEVIVAAAEAKRAAEAQAIIAARPDVTVPNIPEGKTHHLFISHAEEDSEWARNLIKTLEEDKGLKCLWYKRDFKAGDTVVSCINNGISRCMKSLFIMTPAFLQSAWCMSELDWAVGLSVAQKKCLMVPLLLKRCEIPQIFKTFHYIDVPRGEDYVHRIVGAFDPEDDMERMEVSNVEFIQKKGSGLSATICAEKNINSRIIGSGWTFQDISPYKKEEINRLGSKFAEDVFIRARNIVNGSVHLRFYSLSCCAPQCWLLNLSLMALFILIIVLTGFLILFATRIFENTNYLHIVLWPTLVMIPILIYIFTKMCYGKIYRDVVNLSIDHLKDTKVLVYYINSRDKPYLLLMFYDIHPCLDYIANKIRREKTDEDRIQTKAQARLAAENKAISYLRKNIATFMWWDATPNSAIRRHPTYLNKMCLCERMEN